MTLPEHRGGQRPGQYAKMTPRARLPAMITKFGDLMISATPRPPSYHHDPGVSGQSGLLRPPSTDYGNTVGQDEHASTQITATEDAHQWIRSMFICATTKRGPIVGRGLPFAEGAGRSRLRGRALAFLLAVNVK
jgi:hypothetical protein